MKQLLLVSGMAAFIGCGQTENLIGTVPEVTEAGGSTSAGSGGSATAGTAALGGAGGKPPIGSDCTIGDGNWVRCPDGLEHRTEPGSCPSTLPRATTLEPRGSEDQCLQDSDCTAQPHGYCQFQPTVFGDPPARNVCLYGCESDAECGEASVCSCAEPVGRCVQAHSCKSDEDCPGASLCARYDSCPGVSIAFDYACQLPADECLTNADCTGDERYCSMGVSGHRECVREQCAI